MKKDKNRLLSVSSKIDSIDELINKSALLAKRYEAGVTLMYIKEEHLFELPIFSNKEESLEEINSFLREKLKSKGLEDWAILVYDGDIIEHIKIEALRENSLLIVNDLDTSLDDLAKLGFNLFTLKPKALHKYKRALISLDSTYTKEEGIDFALSFIPDAKYKCYMNYSLLVDVLEPGIDPILGGLTPNLIVESDTKIIEGLKKSFDKLCEKRGIKGIFKVDSVSLAKDTLELIKKEEEAEFLALIVEDTNSPFFDEAKEILKSSPIDTLMVFNSNFKE